MSGWQVCLLRPEKKPIRFHIAYYYYQISGTWSYRLGELQANYTTHNLRSSTTIMIKVDSSRIWHNHKCSALVGGGLPVAGGLAASRL